MLCCKLLYNKMISVIDHRRKYYNVDFLKKLGIY